MPAADHQAALVRRGKAHTYIAVTAGTFSATTNRVTGGSESTTSVSGVTQRVREEALGGVEIVQGDEVLLVDASVLQAATVTPKVGDAISYTGSGTYRRTVVGYEPVRGTDGTIWAYRLLLRGAIDRE